MPDKSSNKPVFHYHYAGLTDTGMVRNHNEDAYKLPLDTTPSALTNRGYLYVLADGMGGHQKGEIASAITIEIISEEYYASHIPLSEQFPEKAIDISLTRAVEKANTKVMDATQGGGTTVVATVLYDDTLVSMNVGDSRAYLLRDGQLQLISKDHSLVSRLVEMGKITAEEALTHPRRNVLYQALGQGTDVEIHTIQEKLQLNDIIIICSDGLWGEVGDLQIKEVISTVSNPLSALQQLITMANEAGGPDNITGIIIQVSDKEPLEEGYGSISQSPFPADNDDPLEETRPSVIEPGHPKPNDLPESE